MRAGILAVLCVTLNGPVHADETPPQSVADLDARLERSLAETHVPGAAVAVVEGGEIVLLKGYGYADVSRKLTATPDTVFRAGSISKSLTAIGAMKLVEQGKLDLDARLADLAPEVKFSNPWERTDPVRVAHLIEHTTGWPDITLRLYTLDGGSWSTFQGVEVASEGFVSRYPPGHFPVYNNAGPAVAGYLMEKASGQAFAAYMREHVLRPMGMPTSDFELTPEIATRLSKSYEPDGSETPYQYIILPPAGSLGASARELAQLVRLFLGRGTIDGHALLSEQSVERMERSETTLASAAGFTGGYGLGNAPFPDSGLGFRGHNGSIDSFTSVFGYRAADGIGFVLLANGGDGVDFDSAPAQLVKAYLLRQAVPHASESVTIPAAQLATYEGFYQTITPPNRLMQPYTDMLGLTHVSASDGRLVISGRDFFPTGPHSFRRADRDAPSLGFVDDGTVTYKIGPFNAQARQPLWRVLLIWGTGALLAAGLLLSIVMLPVWLAALARGRLRERGGAAVRFVPVLAYFTLIATFAMPIKQIATSGMIALHRLADVGPYSLAIFTCSLLFPICALVGLSLAWWRPGVGRFVRVYATITFVGMTAVALYTASIGWLGARTWTM